MNILHDELINRFPEIKPSIFEGDEELPYILMGHLFDWVEKELPNEKVILRVINFKKWCETQPNGNSAVDDIYTIFIVGFYEDLFKYKHTMELISRLSSKSDFEDNKEYLLPWIGEENYREVLKKY